MSHPVHYHKTRFETMLVISTFEKIKILQKLSSGCRKVTVIASTGLVIVAVLTLTRQVNYIIFSKLY